MLVGLYAFHIVSKALPGWVWTPHRLMGEDYPAGKLTEQALALLAEAGLEESFRNYRLMGTQNSFTDSTGRPELLGNAVLEPGFGNTSSCITCHSMTSVSATGANLDFLESTEPFEGFVGTPDPSWFFASGSAASPPIFYQTDHLYQLAENANENVRYECSDGCSSEACDQLSKPGPGESTTSSAP